VCQDLIFEMLVDAESNSTALPPDRLDGRRGAIVRSEIPADAHRPDKMLSAAAAALRA
jgi:hypothetical protein